jgi:hypothetical protein
MQSSRLADRQHSRTTAVGGASAGTDALVIEWPATLLASPVKGCSEQFGNDWADTCRGQSNVTSETRLEAAARAAKQNALKLPQSSDAPLQPDHSSRRALLTSIASGAMYGESI